MEDKRRKKYNSVIYFNPITVFLLKFIITTLVIFPVYGYGFIHRCYVCLPNDKESSNAKEIIKLFPDQSIPECSELPTRNPFPTQEEINFLQKFQFNCPRNYFGCAQRSDGIEISRTCAQRKYHRCFKVNTVEMCYCHTPLCNRDNVTAQESPPEQQPSHQEPIRTSRHFSEGETDDEDLLPDSSSQPHLLITEGQGHSHHRLQYNPVEGSGHGGIIDDDEEDEEESHLKEFLTTTSEQTRILLNLNPSSHPNPPQNNDQNSSPNPTKLDATDDISYEHNKNQTTIHIPIDLDVTNKEINIKSNRGNSIVKSISNIALLFYTLIPYLVKSRS